MVRVKVLVSLSPPESVAVTLKLAVPAVVGDFRQGFAVRMTPVLFEVDKSMYFKEFMLVARFAVWGDSAIVDTQALRAVTCHS